MGSMEELRQQCQGCQLCGLGAARKNLVFGDGNPEADIMFIGEGPGKQEDEQGIPFVGAAGQFLSRILEIIDLDRSRYYIANIVKCRPPRNRDPQPEEQDACIPYLNEQIKLVQPKIIICLGRIAAARFVVGRFIGRAVGRFVVGRPAARAGAGYSHPARQGRRVSRGEAQGGYALEGERAAF